MDQARMNRGRAIHCAFFFIFISLTYCTHSLTLLTFYHPHFHLSFSSQSALAYSWIVLYNEGDSPKLTHLVSSFTGLVQTLTERPRVLLGSPSAIGFSAHHAAELRNLVRVARKALVDFLLGVQAEISGCLAAAAGAAGAVGGGAGAGGGSGSGSESGSGSMVGSFGVGDIDVEDEDEDDEV